MDPQHLVTICLKGLKQSFLKHGLDKDLAEVYYNYTYNTQKPYNNY